MVVTENMKHILMLLGRVLFSLVFIAIGFDKAFDPTVNVWMMSNHDIPFAALLFWVSIVFELAAGLMIFFGFRVDIAAVYIFLYFLVISVVLHDFWDTSNVVAHHYDLLHFYKTLHMMGGCIYLFLFGSGKYSVDGVRGK